VFLSLNRIIPVFLLLSLFLSKLWAAENLSLISQQYPPAPVEMTLQQVSEHVYFVEGAAGTALDNEGFISNAGFVVTPIGVVVIDALGTPSLGAMLLKHIRNVTDQPIVKVITTHYHADHIYGLQVFKELGAEIIAPAGANDYLNAPSAAERLEERRFSLDPWVNDKTYLVTPNRVLTQSTEFELGGVKLVVTLVGGAHSDGDLTVYVEPDRVLFSGDIIFEGRVAYLGDANTKRWLDVLQQMETARLVALIPGHGPAAQDPNKAISMTRRYLAYIREVMGEAVESMTAFDEAYAAADWSEFKDLPAFKAANRPNAYHVYFSIEAELFAQ
jgi:glyoxylase-like metal-dependent hydrolase (beta-lactamase superfamily II)